MGYIQVDVDTADVIDGISTEDLEEELAARTLSATSHNQAYEDLYYALRDRDIDAAINAINATLDEKLGRTV